MQAAWAQTTNAIQFTHLTTQNGLSQSNIVCILKDKFGFMWFGTQDGLNRYDGYKFKVYRNKVADKTSLPNNNIRCLLEDHNGNLWVGTVGGGLALYNRNTDSFIRIGYSVGIKEKTGSRIIKSLCEDRQYNIWVGTVSGFNRVENSSKKLLPVTFLNAKVENVNYIYEDSHANLWLATHMGLKRWNKQKNILKQYFADTNDSSSICSENAGAVIEDNAGRIWIGTVDGLSLYNEQTDNFKNFKKDPLNPLAIKDNVIRAFCYADDGKIWIATEQALELMDPRTITFTHFQQNNSDVRSLSSSSISSLLLDDQHILWVGTYAKGVNKYDKDQFKFLLYKNFKNDALDVNANIVTSFAELPDGTVWVGTDGTGLYHWTPKNDEFEAFNPAAKKNYFPALSVLCMRLSKNKDVLWIGTYDSGLIKLNLKTGKKTYYRPGNHNSELNNKSIYGLLEDKNGNVYMATNGGGLNFLNTATNQITHLNITIGKDNDRPNYMRALYEDNEGKIWIGTVAYGLVVYNPANKQVTTYDKVFENLGSNTVLSIYGDSKNNIWVGTMGGGLCRFDKVKGKFIRFTEEQGLPDNIVNCIVEDLRGDLWLSTDHGICCFNPQTYSCKNYTSDSGLQGNEFSMGAGNRLKSGEILFGGLEGFNVFTPGKLKDNPKIPTVIVTDFQLYNKPVPITPKGGPLSQNINTAKEITLSYNQSVFTIEYAALGYTVPERNRYAYKLDGFDKGWSNAGAERKVTYTNLDPGTYYFRVKASNNDGLWNERGTSLKIVIEPPFWKTTWAYLFYIAVAAGAFYFLYREIESREKLKSEIHYQRLLTEKTEELNQVKLNFFTNLSHELRTPLSLILDPLRKMKDEEITIKQAKKFSSLVYNNAAMLMNLVNQLLDFRKVETGGFNLEAGKVDAVGLIKKAYYAFNERARERNIHYILDLEMDMLCAWIDTDKLEKILFNLIANAFKYTPDFGTITIQAKAGMIDAGTKNAKAALEIHIKDSGIGIPDELKSKIFDIFYQIKGNDRFANQSSGIGLALTRELVHLHHGEIFVADAGGQGSDFVVMIPVMPDSVVNVTDEYPGIIGEEEISVFETLGTTAIQNPPEERISGTPIVLIVDDNDQLREYIADELKGFYQVEQAVNGLEGFEKAMYLIPDIIVSDILMPGIDGLEFCAKLKSDEKTSHIPLILLTAKQTDENKIDGYKVGADDYIAKPFNVTLLAARISNILENRKKLRELFSADGNVDIESAKITDIDKEFLKKVVKIVEENLSYLNFDIDKLALCLKMSRRQLYRKLSALTGQTAHDFITNIRLEQAVVLLMTGEYTVSEIGYKVGFSEPSNFSRSFTKKYGNSPKKYLVEQSKQKL